ncbi:hypothetical protein GCM10010972_05290 [Cellulomonas carbonis]|nr:hypothetical protein GCM10010972_05290 [Cellulomonas carbonis]
MVVDHVGDGLVRDTGPQRDVAHGHTHAGSALPWSIGVRADPQDADGSALDVGRATGPLARRVDGCGKPTGGSRGGGGSRRVLDRPRGVGSAWLYTVYDVVNAVATDV